MRQGRYAGMVVLVTKAGHRIGWAVAERFGQDGTWPTPRLRRSSPRAARRSALDRYSTMEKE
jgi:NAD(P)-dependent dehydrogenase (short-subunit alcohol dehydrogenase family)